MDRRYLLALGVGALVVGAAALLLGVALGRSDRDSDDGGPRTVQVTGTGSVKAVPDEADATFGVSATAATAVAARAASDGKQQAVIAALEAQGVEKADIQTAEVSLSPTYSRDGRRIVGYTASNSVTVRIRDLDAATRIIPAVVRAGANQVGGLSLVASDQTDLYGKALEAAVDDARKHAEAIAGASDAELGAIRSVSESSTATPIPFEAKAAADASTPIEPGTIEVTADVSVTFELE